MTVVTSKLYIWGGHTSICSELGMAVQYDSIRFDSIRFRGPAAKMVGGAISGVEFGTFFRPRTHKHINRLTKVAR